MAAQAVNVFLLLQLLSTSLVLADTTDAAKQDEVSYKLYPSYPKYCSTPEEMATRRVPPLLDSDIDSKLVHVTAVIRHGARTPWSDDMRCWDGYWQDSATGIWDCELTTMTSPPPHPFIKEVEDDPRAVDKDPEDDIMEGDNAMFLFEKRYDALKNPPVLSNAFNGTCQKGQLLLRGYEQELANGKHLRNAYVYAGAKSGVPFKTGDEGGAASDPRMRLFELDSEDYGSIRPFEEPHLHYRADDEQRTLMSGQVLLRGLWGPEILSYSERTGEDPVIVLHTGDYKYDVLGPNKNVCERLEDLEDEAHNSNYFQNFNTSSDAKELFNIAQKLGESFDVGDWIDCLMTTMCTDRPLPDVLNDYTDAETKGVFERFLDFATYSSNYKLKHKDGEFAKLAMGPLWHEMLANIRPVVEQTQKAPEDGGGDPPKLALVSGHDTTIMPLLASLGENVYDGKLWTPYASTFLIEIHEVMGNDQTFKGKSRHMFRLVYNGEAITSRMDGCTSDSDLCDASVLLDWVTPFAKIIGRDCKSTKASDDKYSSIKATEKLLTTPGGILILGSMMILCGILGSIGTFVYLTGRLPMCCFTRRKPRPSIRESYSGISLPDRNGQLDEDEGDFENDEKPKSNIERNSNGSDVQQPALKQVTVYGSASEGPSANLPKKTSKDMELI